MTCPFITLRICACKQLLRALRPAHETRRYGIVFRMARHARPRRARPVLTARSAATFTAAPSRSAVASPTTSDLAIAEARGHLDLVTELGPDRHDRAPACVVPSTTQTYAALLSLRTPSAAPARPARPHGRLRLGEEGHPHAHVGAQPLVRLLDPHLDLQGALLAIDLRVELHDLRGVAAIGVRVGLHLGGLAELHAREVGFVHVELGAHVGEIGHADQLARALEAAGHRDLARPP